MKITIDKETQATNWRSAVTHSTSRTITIRNKSTFRSKYVCLLVLASSGVHSFGGVLSYCASKAAVDMMVRNCTRSKWQCSLEITVCFLGCRVRVIKFKKCFLLLLVCLKAYLIKFLKKFFSKNDINLLSIVSVVIEKTNKNFNKYYHLASHPNLFFTIWLLQYSDPGIFIENIVFPKEFMSILWFLLGIYLLSVVMLQYYARWNYIMNLVCCSGFGALWHSRELCESGRTLLWQSDSHTIACRLRAQNCRSAEGWMMRNMPLLWSAALRYTIVCRSLLVHTVYVCLWAVCFSFCTFNHCSSCRSLIRLEQRSSALQHQKRSD